MIKGELRQRLWFGLLFVVGLLIVTFFSQEVFFRPFFAGILALVIVGALWEYLHIAKNKGIEAPVKLVLSGAILYTLAVFLKTQSERFNFLPLILLGLLFLSLFLCAFFHVKNSLFTVAVSFFGVVYIVVPLSSILNITYFFHEGSQHDGRWWLIYLLAVTKMTDVGGLCVGRLFGKNKLARSLSPNKTIEGALGGTLFGLLTSVGVAWIGKLSLGLSLIDAIWFGVLMSIVGQIGDLAESLIKRDGGVKDSNRLPGLGGFLDIVDSLLFTAPLLYLFLAISALE